jgi:hypothetical protein
VDSPPRPLPIITTFLLSDILFYSVTHLFVVLHIVAAKRAGLLKRIAYGLKLMAGYGFPYLKAYRTRVERKPLLGQDAPRAIKVHG